MLDKLVAASWKRLLLAIASELVAICAWYTAALVASNPATLVSVNPLTVTTPALVVKSVLVPCATLTPALPRTLVDSDDQFVRLALAGCGVYPSELVADSTLVDNSDQLVRLPLAGWGV